MNYRHIYHAGNFADVFKHAILVVLLQYLCAKDKPFCYIDTHAGIGLYDLTNEAAQRSPEYRSGISKLLNATGIIPKLLPYLEIIKSYQTGDNLLFYPGSPLIAQYFLREHDQMILNEYHPEDFNSLKKTMNKIPNCHCHQRDAYEFLPAILPPTPKRGLILIDPPYEQETEYDAIVSMMTKSIKRFSNGIYTIWYPIVTQEHQRFIKKITNGIDASLLHCEMTITPIQSIRQGLIGCGALIINPPWQIEKIIDVIVKYLWGVFRETAGSHYRTQLRIRGND